MALTGDDIEWSEDVVTLKELAESVTFPCVVRVCEGYESDDDISSFSLGDLIKLDSHEVIKKIRGKFVQWAQWSDSGRYVKIDAGDVSIPVSYKGCVRVLPKYGVYHVYTSVQKLITDFPRYVEVIEQINGIDKNGSMVTLFKGDVLETVSWKEPKSKRFTSTGYLKCKKAESGSNVIQIPSTSHGKFRVLRDDMEYTLQEVIQRFPLPQIIQFSEQIQKEQISNDIRETIENLDSFEGKMMIDDIYKEQVLFGHYKSFQPDPESTKALKRTAIMLPLSNPDLDEISVQYPLYMDSSDYQLFVTRNFTDTPTGRKILDKALYVEFTKKACMRFAEVDDLPVTTLTEPQINASKNETPVMASQLEQTDKKDNLKTDKNVQKADGKSSFLSGNKSGNMSSFHWDGTLADINWSSSVSDIGRIQDNIKLKKLSKSVVPNPELKVETPESPYEACSLEDNNDDDVSRHDYLDLAKDLGYLKVALLKKRLLHFQNKQNKKA